MSKKEIIVDNLIVGGGFSSIPLLREFEKDGAEYIIINAGRSIWKELEEQDRLDFDLVSSLFSSIYSFDLVERFRNGEDTTDRYMTAKEFFDFQKKHQRQYDDKTVRAYVTRVVNFDDYSLVYTDNNQCYRVKNVIFSTAFTRKIHDTLTHFSFDSSLKDKTVAITSTGDSANLIIAKLVGLGAKIKLITNGFVALDKAFFLGRRPMMILDQLECQNVARLMPALYNNAVSGGYFESQLMPGKITNFLYGPDSLGERFPHATRTANAPLWKLIYRIFLSMFPSKNRLRHPANGIIAIKYWPIDTYRIKFAQDSESLKTAIEEGYIFNDLIYFIDQNFVELWDKKQTVINKENKTLSSGNNESEYDYLIEGSREVPNLPEIIYKNAQNQDVRFEFIHKKTFMGVMAPELQNIYFLGYARPMTGGLCNVVEMQCLLIHHLINDQNKKNEITATIDSRISVYNKTHYISNEVTPTDNSVYYGFYTDEIADLIGIRPKLRHCRSWRDFSKYLYYPNNAHYYRQEGEYAVEGVSEMVDAFFNDIFRPWFSFFYSFIIMANVVLVTYFSISPFSALLGAAVALLSLVPAHLLASLISGNWGIWNLRKPNHKQLLFFVPLIASSIATTLTANPIYSVLGLSFSILYTRRLRKKGLNKGMFSDLYFKKFLNNNSKFMDDYKTAFTAIYNKKAKQPDVQKS